ncbi:shikimate dehydrogenase [Pseudomonas syringae]|uniref:Shikimate 5-dehydrogenase n=1 Tax=Pseudomonas syringae pv. apii TaxID=81036 RepID=A0A3M3MUD1_9PSED|nr:MULTISPECIES: shikimate 5-dehydrogenase [Pseudomonas syringae group]RMN43370.1 Shikimate 5-dehydrogenase [Pseudomonas syringae pv. apii]RMN51107.1 Shikimate 5-dehydrogenase [Pseudomonas syringae pv. apii]RMO01678.1 Shikimate 5-dehydrogenase [Pseudomonas syringae pv. apii]SDZ17992.1 shikimate dehydrogenase [Pseudomonas syringae]
MPVIANRDTQLCMSMAARPGNFGVRFHNHLFQQLDLNFYYKTFSPNDLTAAVAGIRSLGIRGSAVSMPFKEACIELVDELDVSAAAIQSINTIVNTDGHLKAFNTDYIAVAQLMESHAVPHSAFALRGSGGMAKAVAFALRDAGFTDGLIVARNQQAGQRLAEACGFRWQADLGRARPPLLVNVTPLGMQGPQGDELAFDMQAIEAADTIFDVVATPADTPLIQAARRLGKRLVSGDEVAAIQALEQFVLYTGIRPTDEQYQQAVEFARAG